MTLPSAGRGNRDRRRRAARHRQPGKATPMASAAALALFATTFRKSRYCTSCTGKSALRSTIACRQEHRPEAPYFRGLLVNSNMAGPLDQFGRPSTHIFGRRVVNVEKYDLGSLLRQPMIKLPFAAVKCLVARTGRVPLLLSADLPAILCRHVGALASSTIVKSGIAKRSCRQLEEREQCLQADGVVGIVDRQGRPERPIHHLELCLAAGRLAR